MGVGGYRVAFIIGAAFAALAATISAKMLRAQTTADAVHTGGDANGCRPALADAH